MSSKAEIRAHNQKTRDDFWSLLESLVRECTAPLEERDNSNQEVTRRLFEEDGRSNFEHQAWRETEMLPAMIRLHQDRYLKLNPQEQWVVKVSNKDLLSFEEHIRLEQEADEDGLTEADWSEKRRLIAPSHSRKQLEIWAAEILLKKRKKAHHRQERSNEPTPSKNKNPDLRYEDLLNEAIIIEGMSKKAAAQARSSANKAIHRALEGKSETNLPIQIQERGNLDQYMIIRLGKPRPSKDGSEPKTSPTDCVYQKI